MSDPAWMKARGAAPRKPGEPRAEERVRALRDGNQLLADVASMMLETYERGREDGEAWGAGTEHERRASFEHWLTIRYPSGAPSFPLALGSQDGSQ
jgi:hypothetical protein